MIGDDTRLTTVMIGDTPRTTTRRTTDVLTGFPVSPLPSPPHRCLDVLTGDVVRVDNSRKR